jgi:2,4-dienoyl-CoA reductase-like NADH-dependent reductase (Old Yellow Enzyme family)
MIRKLVGNGGSLENRMRFPVEVAAAVRAALPGDTPLFARISAVDWIDGGWEMDDSVALAKALKGAGVDVVDCSSGGNLLKGATNSNLARSPGYRAPFARRLREEAAVMTQAVGLIRTPGLAEQLLRDGYADIIAIGRQMLYDRFWPHHAAEAMGQRPALDG